MSAEIVGYRNTWQQLNVPERVGVKMQWVQL